MKKKKKKKRKSKSKGKGKLEFAPRQWTRDRPCQGQGREGLATEVSDRLCFRHEYTITTTNYLTFTPLPDPFPRIHHPLPRSNDILELRSYFALYCLVPSSISTSRSLPTIPIIARDTRRRQYAYCYRESTPTSTTRARPSSIHRDPARLAALTAESKGPNGQQGQRG